MMKLVAVLLISCGAVAAPAIAADLPGANVDFYPNQSALDEAIGNPVDTAGAGDALDVDSVSDADLKTMSGGIGIVGDVQYNVSTNSSSQSNNTVSGDVDTGSISGTNVSNVAGFNTILLNTGNNVTMQSITEVNIILK